MLPSPLQAVNGREALKYIGSVNGAAAGAEDGNFDAAMMPPMTRWTSADTPTELEMSKADFLAIVGGKGDYGVAEDWRCRHSPSMPLTRERLSPTGCRTTRD